MDYFHYKRGRLYCEDVDVHEIAEKFGTPAYVYSQTALRSRFRALADAFAEFDPLVCYSVKSNWNLSIMKTLQAEGAGFDIVSVGELLRALEIGADPSKIVFAGVGKRPDEIRAALEAGILMFNVESVAELGAINTMAKETGRVARIALRLNPDVDAGAHKKTTTGTKENKFGIGLKIAREIIGKLKRLKHVRWAGVHLHLGSPIYSPEPYVKAIRKVIRLLPEFRAASPDLEYLNIGGGYCMSYTGEPVVGPEEYAAAIAPLVRKTGLKLIMEPGRHIVASAGALLTRVVYRKTQDHGKKFLIVDAAMNDLIRPTLYDAFQRIWKARSRPGMPAVVKPDEKPKFPGPMEVVDVVGGVCESGDYLAQRRWLPVARQGDLLCVFDAGAYGMSMSSNYNTRPRPCEVLVDGARCKLVRRRETFEDLIAPERGLF